MIAMETDKDPIHFLLGYDMTDRVCDIVKVMKQETIYYLWQKYRTFLSKHDWKKKSFGLIDILRVASEKCYRQPYLLSHF